MEQHAYDVTLTGRAWSPAEWETRHSELPFKPELIRGKLYWTERERLTMLAALLEHCGAAAAVRIGDPNVWREAVQGLE
jgi:hypothetical protein